MPDTNLSSGAPDMRRTSVTFNPKTVKRGIDLGQAWDYIVEVGTLVPLVHFAAVNLQTRFRLFFGCPVIFYLRRLDQSIALAAHVQRRLPPSLTFSAVGKVPGGALHGNGAPVKVSESVMGIGRR